MSGNETRQEIDFDVKGNRTREVVSDFLSRLEIDYEEGKMKAGILFDCLRKKNSAFFAYTYDDLGNLVEQTQTGPANTLIGKFIWTFLGEDLEKQEFTYIDGFPPMGDGGPAYRDHATKIEFKCVKGLILEEKIDAWAGTADGGHFSTIRYEYDSEQKLISRTICSKPQMERSDNPFGPSETRTEFVYDEKGLLIETKSEDSRVQKASKSRKPETKWKEYVYEFYP
jgi:hypothetical protein